MGILIIFVTFLIIFNINRGEATIFGFEQLFGNSTTKDYQVYWNVPTFMCHKYGMYFEEVSRNFGIIQNSNDYFRGSEIAILYDPGMFPALSKNPNGSLVERNGGVPQAGDLKKHLEIFERHLVEQITNMNFRGIGIIDFESWRPIFRQNWGSLSPYQALSIKIETRKHPLWDKNSLKKEAVRNFEKWAKIFMEETLKLAITLRPHAQWGYYAYPYCFNVTPKQLNSQCSPEVLSENNKMSWLFNAQNILFPSVYLPMSLSNREKMARINGRVREAVRISKKSRPRTKVLTYFWYKYQDKTDLFLSRDIIVNGFREILEVGADGYVIWGSSNDLNSREKCKTFRNYLNDILGPAVVESKELAKQRDNTNDENYTTEKITMEIDEDISNLPPPNTIQVVNIDCGYEMTRFRKQNISFVHRRNMHQPIGQKVIKEFDDMIGRKFRVPLASLLHKMAVRPAILWTKSS